ncbi:hypothetical protein ABT008_14990 [Micromonospora sp. NPDC002389]|uniref:hypothetical protein n=1 Tax=Micromonospora sp. NPDC002389 TaxID=3154272 RepID=UPI00332791FA
MSVDRLRELCVALRRGTITCDEDLVTDIEADVESYRREAVRQTPPDHLAARLPLMGWLLYEATWNTLRQINDGRREHDENALAEIERRYELIARAVSAARNLPWPEYAARALGAFRSQALAASKRDTQDGYDRARMLHQDARTRHSEFLSYHRSRDAAADDPYLRALDEVLVQLVLAETGTACRIAERIIGHWVEDFPSADQVEYTQRMFDQLAGGVEIGEQALVAADRVKKHHGFVDEVNEYGLALPTSFINPGIMTARAVLLMLALAAEMETIGRLPLGDDETWQQSRERLRGRFEHAYQYIERPIEDSNGRQVEPRDDLKVQIVQTRLSAALIMPGHRLPSALTFAACLEHETLDDEAVEAMCVWLSERVTDSRDRQKQRSVHRGIGSAIMPRVIDSIEECRSAFGGAPGYREWRARWFVLDAYAHEKERAERVEKVLGLPVRRQRPI